MSSYVFMKILESSPGRYDRGMAILSLGKLSGVYDRLTSGIKKNESILDIGCGTGEASLRAAKKGANVTAIDINPQMLEIARRKTVSKELASRINFQEKGAAELSDFNDKSFDKVISCLCFSELSEDEINYTLEQAFRILKDSGLLIIADESRPKNILKRAAHFLLRLPIAIIVYMYTQTTTRAVKNLDKNVSSAGFKILETRKNFLESFIEIRAKKDAK